MIEYRCSNVLRSSGVPCAADSYPIYLARKPLNSYAEIIVIPFPRKSWTMEEPMNLTNIPQTDSIQKLAHFWDTHDLTDFEDELEEVKFPVFERNATVTVPLRLEPEESERLQALAKSRGISPANLIREWVIEGIEATSEPTT